MPGKEGKNMVKAEQTRIFEIHRDSSGRQHKHTSLLQHGVPVGKDT